MSETTTRPGPAVPTARAGQYPTTNTATLLRFMLRRDRLRLTLWVLGIGLMGLYMATAVQTLVEDEADLPEITTLFTDPVGRLMTGPAYGMDAPTFERFYAAGYVLFIYILVALMSVFTVVRHTRAEEQTRRAELVRANVVGRHASLSAALVLAAMAAVGAGLLVLAGALVGGFAVPGSVLVGVGCLAIGLFFAGATAVSAQLSESSRGAAALAGGLLGAAYVIRMGGDMARQGGSALSWFSPLGWVQQTAPYVEDRWWPLLLPVGSAVVLVALGYWLSTQRDVEASLVPTRLGRAAARPGLGSAPGLAARTLRGGLRGWGIALLLCGLLFGGYAQSLLDAADELPEELRVMFSGESVLLGYLAYMGVFLALFVAAAGVSGLQQVRGEEVRGRAELALSVPIGRNAWLGSHLVVLSGGLVAILALAGLGTAVGVAAVLEDDGGRYFGDLLLAFIHQTPAVLAVLGIVVALFGWFPRAAGGVGWVLIAYAAFMTNFGQLLDVPDVFGEFNVFGHLAQYPVEAVEWGPVVWLSAIAVGGVVLGLIGWRRREVNRV